MVHYGSVGEDAPGRTASRRQTGVLHDDADSHHGLRTALFENPQVEHAASHRGRTAGWVTIATLCGIALGATTGVAHFGYSPTNASSSIAKSDGATPGGSFLANDKEGDLLVSPSEKHDPAAPSLSEETPAASPPLAFSALNFYHERDGKPGKDYPWLKDVKLIEPFRETTLAVTEPRDGFEYHWEIMESRTNRVSHTEQGEAVVVTLTMLEEHKITLKEVHSLSGDLAKVLEEDVLVKYVRREIRTITDDEREELLDAMYTLWSVKVDGGNGQEVYGDDYADIWAIHRLHFKGGIGGGDCDHFHDGVGFLTTHVMLSNTFEHSLQVVNPKLTLPYWDFTIETSSAGNKDYNIDEPVSRSPLLQSSWFGGADPVDDVVKDGRWAYTKIPSLRDHNPGGLTTNVYSHLRAPWNLSNRPFLSRGLGKNCQLSMEEMFPWPTCSSHYDAITNFSSFNDWSLNVQKLPHGSVHFWVGGIIDCDSLYTEIAGIVGKETASKLTLQSMYHRKGLYCTGQFRCEGRVDLDVTPTEVMESGVCGCLDYDLTQGDDYLSVMSAMTFVEDYLAEYDADTKRKVISLLCSGVTNYGENTEAASSIDPTFWPIHPTVERLWAFSVLSGAMTDQTWADSEHECTGHSGSNVFPFDLLEYDTNGFQIRTGLKNMPSGGNTLTNRELLKRLDPHHDSMTYIYDTFQWPHCEDDGFDFDGLRSGWGR